ncbi:hypothetical protein [Halomonas cerina]|uniref:Uncharacterized protein n=1 Tax=Halomonas cerina TaxID=447424 RepID=A0A839VA85_9GAMM|nr:hypothetical protein [Halomonas cerina]
MTRPPLALAVSSRALFYSLELATVALAPGHVDEGLAVELDEVAHQPFINPVGEQQYPMPFDVAVGSGD